MPVKYYTNKFGRVYGEKMVTPRAGAAWPYLLVPREAPKMANQSVQQGQKAADDRYEVTLVISKADSATALFVEEVETMVEEMMLQYNATAKKLGRPGLALDNYGLIDGDNNTKFPLEKYPYYEHAWLLIARNNFLPVYKNYKGEKMADGAAFQGGDIVRAEVTPHIGPTGVSFKLEAIQLIKRGEVAMGGWRRDHGAMLGEDPEGEEVEAAVRAVERVSVDSIEDPEMEQEETPAPAAAPQVQLTGKQLADKLKDEAVAAAKGQVVQAPKVAQVVAASEVSQPVAGKGKMAAVDLL